MNWGYKLLVGFLAFVFLMSFLVYKSLNTKYELVSKDYYKDEIRYQEKIDGRTNAAKISDISITQNDSTLIVNMPQELKGKSLTGELWFYCATNELYDRRIPLKLNENHQHIIQNKELVKTKYLLKFTWQEGTTHYYVEKELTVK